MTFKKFIRAFVAGMVFPAVVLPIVYSVLFHLKLHSVPHNYAQFVPMYIPLLFGLANAIHAHVSDGSTAKNTNTNLWLTGIFLGIFVAAIGIFVLHLPTEVFGFKHAEQYAPLFILPIVYGLVFRFIVKWLNKAIAV